MTELPDYFPHDRPHVPGSEDLPSSSVVPLPLTGFPWTPMAGWGMTAVVLASILVFGFASAAIQLIDMPLTVRSVVGGVLLMCAYLVPLTVLYAISRRTATGFADLVGLRPGAWRPVIVLGIIVGVLGRFAAALWGILIEIIGVELPGEVGDPMQLLPQGAIGMTFIVLTTVVLAPLAEEAIFRGVLLPSLHDRWGRAAAMSVSSVVFAATHVVPITIPPLFAFALMLSWVFVRSRTLWTAIIAHAVFNGLGLAAYFILQTVTQ